MRHMASMSNSDVTWTSWRLKWPTTRLFVQQFTQTNIKRNIKGPRPWSFVRGNHWSPVNSHYKGPATRKTFPCDDVIIDEWVSVLVLSSWSITVTLNERHAVSNHPPIDCLSNSLLKLTAKKTYFVRFIDDQWIYITRGDKQRFLTPGHQGWNDLHRLCRFGMEYYLPNNDNNSNNSNDNNNNDNDNDNDNNNNNNNNKTMMMMIIIIIRMMTMMIIGTTTIMIMIIIITKTLTMTIMKMIMIKTAQTPCQSLYKDRRIQNKIAWYKWYNKDDVMLILYEMLQTCSIMHTQWRCNFENTKHRCLGMFLHKCNLHCSGRN